MPCEELTQESLSSVSRLRFEGGSLRDVLRALMLAENTNVSVKALTI